MYYKVSDVVYTKIRSFYVNVARKYRHTYSVEDILRDTHKAREGVFLIENGLLRCRPTLSHWKGLFMASTDKWFYAYRIDGNTIYVEDACHVQNMKDAPSAIEFNSTFSLPQGTRILKGEYYNGLKIGYHNRKYVILDKNGNPLVKRWFDAKPKMFEKPFGPYNIISHVNYKGDLFSVNTNGQMYNMNKTWSEAYLDEVITRIIRGFITEAIISGKRTFITESRNNGVIITERQLRGLIRRVIHSLIA